MCVLLYKTDGRMPPERLLARASIDCAKSNFFIYFIDIYENKKRTHTHIQPIFIDKQMRSLGWNECGRFNLF